MAGVPSRLLMADTGSDAYKQLDEDAMGYTAREMEAKMIAGEIRRLTDETDGLLVWIRSRRNTEGPVWEIW